MYSQFDQDGGFKESNTKLIQLTQPGIACLRENGHCTNDCTSNDISRFSFLSLTTRPGSLVQYAESHHNKSPKARIVLSWW
jgi:hypothetical protein